MGIKFNPLIFSGLDLTGGASLATGSTVTGADPNSILAVDSASKITDIVLTDGQLIIGSTGNFPVKGTITGTTNQVNVVTAPGSITLSLPQSISTASSPTFAGMTVGSLSGPVKATAGVLSSSAIDLSSTEVTNILPTTKGGTGLNGSTASNGKLLVGTGTGFALANIGGTVNQVTVTNGSGSITLSLPQDIATGSSPTFGNVYLGPSGALDVTSIGTIAIGTVNANVINIGNSGATVNIQGSTIYENVTQLQVKDPLITINKGGAVGSGSSSGIEIEENALITGYAQTSADRNSWSFKAPGTAGIVSVTPGAAGFTLNQGSHNPVTLAAVGSTPNTNGASLSSQVLTLQPADATNPGVITSGAQTFGGNKTFSGTISASNLSGTNTGDQTITLTGDVSGTGTGSFATTLATVNSTPGSFGSATAVGTFTVNAKGLVTASGSTSIQIAESQVTNLVSDLAGKQPTGNYITALTGDITAAGPGSVAATLATVNTTIGSYGSATAVATFTVNGKGLVTVSGSTPIQIAESQVTNLVTDLAGKQPTGNYITALTGDATASGPGSVAITLATVNSTPGSFGSASSVSSVTVNGKGLVTASSSTPIAIAASQVTSGLLSVARGGTGVDGSTAANGSLLIGNGSGYTLTTLTAGTGITISNTSGAISIANPSASAFDIAPGTWAGLANNTANQAITGFSLNAATVTFSAIVYVAITATANTFSALRINGVRKGADWSVNDLVTDINGDAITGLAFSVTAAGQVQITIGNISGFTSASVKFRAQVLS